MNYLVILSFLLSCIGILCAENDYCKQGNELGVYKFNAVRSLSEGNLNNDIETLGTKENNLRTKRITTWYEPPGDQVKVKTFTQPIDHFSEASPTWQMEVKQYPDFWVPQGTVYIFLGKDYYKGENSVTRGLMWEIVNATRGVVFAANPRLLTRSFTELEFLNVNQTLEDLSNLAADIKSDEQYKDSQVVLVGCGLGGTLAVWASKHTQIFDAVVASGAPVIPKIDFREYFERVRDLYTTRMPCPCVTKIKTQFSMWLNLFKKPDHDTLVKRVQLCNYMKIREKRNQELFLYEQLLVLAETALDGFLPMKNLCRKIMGSDVYAKFDNENSLFFDKEQKCYDYSLSKLLQKVRSHESFSDMKLWLWRSCTELGWFQTTSRTFLPDLNLVISVDFFMEMCSKVFGNQYNLAYLEKGVKRINSIYGDLTDVKNILYVHGEDDPWRDIEVQYDEQISYSSFIFKMRKATHCNEMWPSDTPDHEVVAEDKRLLIYWLQGTLRDWEE